jgi:subtilisin family serine protease
LTARFNEKNIGRFQTAYPGQEHPMQYKSSVAALLAAAGLGSALLALPLVAQAQPGERVSVAVGHKAGAGPAVRSAVSQAGGRVLQDMAEVNALVVDVPRSALSNLASHKQVDFVDAGAERRILRTAAPASLPGSPQVAPYGIAMVQADKVSDSAAANRTLCIVDSGIDGTHEDLSAVPMTGENFTKSGAWNTDENSHGTHVAGTIAALNNGVGVVGVAPSGRLHLHIAKVFDASGSASSVTIARAMLNCWRSGANVVSMSLGGDSASPIERRVATLLANKGVLQIAAAGNDGNAMTSYPAGFAEVMSVAAIDENKAVASFSQYNADVEIAAPGVAVQSTVPAYSQTGASVSVGGTSFPVISMENSPRVSATGALADFGLGTAAVAGSMSGKVCLIKRGSISFAEKVLNCQNSGGVGAVVYNNTTGELNGTLGETVTSIPSVGATQADGETMLTKLGQSTQVAVFGLPDVYAAYSGTSMATPHVSAVAAVVWSLHPQCTAEQVRASLNKSALDLGAAGRDVHYGHGLVQAKSAHDRITSLGCGN